MRVLPVRASQLLRSITRILRPDSSRDPAKGLSSRSQWSPREISGGRRSKRAALKLPSGRDGVRGSPAHLDSGDLPARDEIVLLDEIPERPHQPAGGNLCVDLGAGVRLGRELRRPRHAVGVGDLDFRLRAGDVFLDKGERWPGCGVRAAGPPIEVLRPDRPRITPEESGFLRRTGFDGRRTQPKRDARQENSRASHRVPLRYQPRFMPSSVVRLSVPPARGRSAARCVREIEMAV